MFDLYDESRNNFETSELVKANEPNSTQKSSDYPVNSNSLTDMLSQMISVTDDNLLSGL